MNSRLPVPIMLLLCITGWGAPPEPAMHSDPHRLKILVGPRIELLAVIQSLSDYDDRYGLLTDHDFRYRRDIQAHFAPYKDHEAVRLLAVMSAKGFSLQQTDSAMDCQVIHTEQNRAVI